MLGAGSKRQINLTLILMTTLLLACASEPKKDPLEPQLKYPEELEAVHALVIKGKTVDAREKVEDYLNRSENIHWYGHAYFLKGFVYEIEEDFDNSIKFYRQAIDHGSQYESRVEAKALYNLSFVYEKLDRRNELLVSLIDLMKRRSFFDPLTGQVEIPARMAAAYASQGKMKEALIFHREASTQFNKLVRTASFRARKSDISKALYYMGLATYDQNDEAYNQMIRKLSVGQKYFLASAEASRSKWSEKAEVRVKALYNKAWGEVLQYKPKGFEQDVMAFKKNQHRDQLEMASDLYDLMHRMRAQEFPLSDVNRRSKAIMDETQVWITKIENFAQKLDVGPETIRKNKRIKNKKLVNYLDVHVDAVIVNKEQVSKATTKPKNSTEKSKKALPAKQDIGKDPNL